MMSTWYVWGDFVHTIPQQIGNARLQNRDDRSARKVADEHGFDLERRIRNGFESWAATYAAERDDGEIEFSFACFPTVRGWHRV